MIFVRPKKQQTFNKELTNKHPTITNTLLTTTTNALTIEYFNPRRRNIRPNDTETKMELEKWCAS